MQKACNFGHRYENTNSNTDVTIHEQVAAPLHTDGNKILHSYGLERRDLNVSHSVHEPSGGWTVETEQGMVVYCINCAYVMWLTCE